MNKMKSTMPSKVVGVVSDSRDAAWQLTDDIWSFGPGEHYLFAPKPGRRPTPSDRRPMRNNDEGSTETPAGSVDHPRPRRLEPRNFGRRSSTPISHWEGVVDAVGDGNFHARLVPFEDGVASTDRVEMASFDFDELVDDSDVHLICAGATFYWTLARNRNAAGTVTNSSMVRFRRVPAATKKSLDEAANEADQFLALFGDET